MKTQIAPTRIQDLPETYEGLCRHFLPRPIHDPVQYRNTCAIAGIFAGHDLNKDQEDYFELLCELIETYEKPLSPEPTLKPLDLLAFLMEQHQINGSDLAKWLHVDRSLVSRIFNGERQLTVNQIKTLGQKFGVSPALFIG
ncbi:MAG: helix-turn-helix domain-containing protein [Verrucomicrobiae bacterium]|nr:helix-turn-helix domain-containing protein [Verrucomicrobiae bacterium]